MQIAMGFELSVVLLMDILVITVVMWSLANKKDNLHL